MSDALQIDISGMAYIDCGSSNARIGITVGHRMEDPETPDSKPYNLVILTIERAGSDTYDTVSLTTDAALAIASWLHAKAIDVGASSASSPTPE